MIRRRVALIVIAVVSLADAALLVYGAVLAAGPTAALAPLDGRVEVQHGGGEFTTASPGLALRGGDVVRAATGHAAVTFGERSVVRLDRGAELVLRDTARLRVEQRRGRAWYELPAGGDGADVVAGAAEVTGGEPSTRFSVLMSASGVRVDDWMGALRAGAGGQKVALQAGQSTDIPTGRAPGRPAPIAVADGAEGFTLLNRALDVTQGGLLDTAGGTLQRGQSTDQVPLPEADGQTNLQLVVAWSGPAVQLVLQSPDGASLDPISATTSPASVQVPAAAGVWHVKITAGDATTPWALATAWRPQLAEEAGIRNAATRYFEARTAAAAPADLQKIEAGSALADDLARLSVATKFPDGSNPIAVHWESHKLGLDGVDPFAVRGRGDLALAVSHVHSTGSGWNADTMVTVFQRSASGWQATASLEVNPSVRSTALAVDADGYITPLDESAQERRYVFSAKGVESALAAYFDTGQPGRLDPDADLSSLATDFRKPTTDLGEAVTAHGAPAPGVAAYGVPLQDGSMLALVALRETHLFTPPAGTCIQQPSPPRPGGGFTAKIGLAKGVYASLSSTGIVTYGVIVPAKASPDHQVKLLGAKGLFTIDASPPCTAGQQPVSVPTGDYVEI